LAVFGLAAGARALVVAPHPDDETLGSGGTIARLTARGVAVHVLAVACRAGPMWSGHSDPAVRIKEFNAACDALGVTGRQVAWAGDDRADRPELGVRAMVGLIESGTELALAELRPDLMLIPAGSGFHEDHQATHRACFAAARHGGAAKPAPRLVLGFAGPEDTWTAAAEPWRVHVDITATWPAKLAALTAYTSQLREMPHPRSIEGIRAGDTSAGTAIGAGMAEAFVPYRMAF
jgi:LmbE family N-acetylglucosaminyl deacetylase